MNQQMKNLKEIAQIADSKDFQTKVQELGEVASNVFRPGQRNQLTNLNNIANSSLKVTDVINYIKKQVARADRNETWRKNNFGTQLKKYIEQNLRERQKRVKGVKEDSAEGQRFYLYLVREFLRQLVIHYEYRLTVGDESDDDN